MNNYEEKVEIQPDSYDTIAIDSNATSDLENKTIDLSESKNKDQVSNTPIETESTESTSLYAKMNQHLQTLSEKITTKSSAMAEKINIAPSYKYFLILLSIGGLFVFLSLMTLPMIVFSPARFVLTFGIGNVLILISFLFYFGGKEYCLMLFSEKRKWLSLLFVVSLLLGIVFAWRKHFIMSLAFALIQMTAMIMFTLSFIPGGAAGINAIAGFAKASMSSVFSGIKRKFSSQQSELPI